MNTYQRIVQKSYGMLNGPDDRKVRFLCHIYGMGIIKDNRFWALVNSHNENVQRAVKSKLL